MPTKDTHLLGEPGIALCNTSQMVLTLTSKALLPIWYDQKSHCPQCN
jgi:hypothetical protein